MYVFKLEMCIFSLEMYISNLEMKTQTALSCFFCHFQTSFRRIVSHDQWLFAVVRIRAGIYFFPIFGKIITFVAVEQFRLSFKQ